MVECVFPLPFFSDNPAEGVSWLIPAVTNMFSDVVHLDTWVNLVAFGALVASETSAHQDSTIVWARNCFFVSHRCLPLFGVSLLDSGFLLLPCPTAPSIAMASRHWRQGIHPVPEHHKTLHRRFAHKTISPRTAFMTLVQFWFNCRN